MDPYKHSAEFWRDRRVLVTGHTGFIGAWLSLLLWRLGATVSGYALAPATDPSLYALAGVEDTIDSRIGDVRDRHALTDSLGNADIVFHLAAQSLVREGYVHPADTYLTNVQGTVNVLEAARNAGNVRALVVVTSDKCYENLGVDHAYAETDALGGHDPYSSSKACAEIAVASWYRSFMSVSIGVATVRAGNVIGGGDWAKDRIVPDLVRALTARRSGEVRNPHAVRPWQHVLEPLSAMVMLAERLCASPADASGAWNVGPETESRRPVSELADAFCTAWGDGAAWHTDVDSKGPHEAALLSLDSTRIRERLGWRPRWPFERAVQETAHWYREHARGVDARALTIGQIESYAAGSH